MSWIKPREIDCELNKTIEFETLETFSISRTKTQIKYF
jgi:hypothetical protein